jgi:hypothetical protein
MTEEEGLVLLREHWGSAYAIKFHSGLFIAVRRDTRALLTAPAADELMEKIRADYRERPVPRDR